MVPCSSCGCHVRASDAACPSCGAAHRRASLPTVTAVALLMGLAACSGEKTDDTHSGGTPQPEYGVTTTDTVEDTGPQ
jgi:hypothetical protein